VLVLHSALALGHAGAAITAIDVHDDGGTIEASYGLLVDDGRHWVCHEAITTPDALLAPRYAHDDAGAWLGWVSAIDQVRDPAETLYRSETGCDWAPVDGLTGRVVSAAIFLPRTALAATASLGDDVDNGVFVSTDGGARFEPSSLLDPTRLVLSLAAGPGEVAWATSVWPVDHAAWVHHSVDGGATWSTHPLDLSAWEGNVGVRVLAASPTDGEVAWIGVAPLGGDTLLRAEAGGARTSAVLAVDGDLVDVAVDATGAVWAVEALRRVWRSEDGVVFADAGATVPGIGLGATGDEALLAANAELTGMLVGRVAPGGATSSALRAWETTGPLACPEGSDVGRVCEPAWERVAPRLDRLRPTDTGLDDTGAADADVHCGCATPVGIGWPALLLPLLWRRRC
jgi:hypothetical protein